MKILPVWVDVGIGAVCVCDMKHAQIYRTNAQNVHSSKEMRNMCKILLIHSRGTRCEIYDRSRVIKTRFVTRLANC